MVDGFRRALGVMLMLGLFPACVPVAAAADRAVTVGDQVARGGYHIVDFDGNGLADLAVGVPYEDVGSLEDAGAVQILYGSSTGLTATNNQSFTQDSSGIADAAEAEDRFGESLAMGDLNDDGFTDLVVGVPSETVADGRESAGAVHVLYGSASGLTSAGSQYLTQDTPGVDGGSEFGDQFGSALAIADFGGTPAADLAIGVPQEDLGSLDAGGAVHILYGSAAGLTATNSQFLTQDTAGIPGGAEEDDRFGIELAAVDLGRTAQAELVVGVPLEDVGDAEDAGAVHVLYGTANGLTTVGSQMVTQNSNGLAGVAEASDRFGSTLAAADFGRSVHGDLAVAADHETVGSVSYAGAVHVLYGSANGLSTAGDQMFTESTSGVAGVAEDADLFGAELAAANVGRTAQADLVISVPLEDVGAVGDAGVVHVLYGSTSGITTVNAQVVGQNTAGVPDSAESEDQFGQAVAAANFGRSAYADLAICAEEEDFAGVSAAGGVHVLYGSANGLSTTDSQLLSQATAGIAGDPEEADFFGYVLAAG